MEILQKNRGMSNFYEVVDFDSIGEYMPYEIGMLKNNDFRYLVRTRFMEMDQKNSQVFKIDGLSNLKNFFRQVAPGKADLIKLLKDIRDCIKELGEFILFPENLLLSLNYIFYDKNEDIYKFLYVPGYKKSFNIQIKKLIEEIMQIYDHQNKDDVIYLYDLYGKMLVDNFTPNMYCQLVNESKDIDLDKSDKSKLEDIQLENKIRKKDEDEAIKREETCIEYPDEKSDKENEKNIKVWLGGPLILAIAAGLLFFFGIKSLFISTAIMMVYLMILFGNIISKKNTEEIDRYMEEYREKNVEKEITVYPAAKKEVSKLVALDSSNEGIALITEGMEIKIGRIKGECDLVIESKGISRLHAVIIKNESGVFIRDMGSTNGTYINNRRLAKGEDISVHHGDLVSFAGVEYYCL